METNKKIKTVSLIMILFIIIVSILAIMAMIKLAAPEQTDLQIETTTTSDIKKEAYDKITTPTNYGTPVSANEEGFGRENPFAPF